MFVFLLYVLKLYWAKGIYNVTVVYFDNITELANITSQIFIQNKTSISEASFDTNFFFLFFPTVQEINHFMEIGCLAKMKCILVYQFPACGLYFVQRRTDFWDFSLEVLDSQGIQCLPNVILWVARSWNLLINKQEFAILLILGLSGNFRICQRKHGAMQLGISLDLCFLIFLRNKRKQLLISGWIIFLFSGIIALLCMDFLAINA